MAQIFRQPLISLPHYEISSCYRQLHLQISPRKAAALRLISPNPPFADSKDRKRLFKREWNEQLKKREMSKKNRCRGQNYVNRAGKGTPNKKISNGCSGKSKRKCHQACAQKMRQKFSLSSLPEHILARGTKQVASCELDYIRQKVDLGINVFFLIFDSSSGQSMLS